MKIEDERIVTKTINQITIITQDKDLTISDAVKLASKGFTLEDIKVSKGKKSMFLRRD